MIKEFIPYKEALALKELGFDKPCFGFWNESQHLDLTRFVDKNKELLKAPVYQQAFRWFRKKHGLDAEIMPYNFNRKEAKILGILKGKKYVFILDDDELPELKKINFFNTYEEAEQACLKELIKIVKEKK